VGASLAFFTAGEKEITCITVDSKDAQSSPATRKIHVHNSGYTSSGTPAPGYNFNNRPDASNSSAVQNCPCQHQDKAQQETQEGIDFNRPYIPGYPTPDPQSMYQPPKRQADLSGRVVYRSSGRPVRDAMIKLWNPVSGQAYNTGTDGNGVFEFNFMQKDLTGLIQAAKGNETSVIREVQIKPDQPAVIDLTIIDSAPAAPATPLPQSQSQSSPYWPPSGQATPPARNNSVWQFN